MVAGLELAVQTSVTAVVWLGRVHTLSDPSISAEMRVSGRPQISLARPTCPALCVLPPRPIRCPHFEKTGLGDSNDTSRLLPMNTSTHQTPVGGQRPAGDEMGQAQLQDGGSQQGSQKRWLSQMVAQL